MKLPLNDPQQAAVSYLDGPLLVLAGAGSGKTRVITAKVAHLIGGGMDAGRISGGASWFERSEIQDLIAYLRLIANDDDDPAFVRAVTTPKRGVGQTTLARLADVSAARKESLFAAAFAPELAALIPAKQRDTLHAFCMLVKSLRFRA